MKTRLLLTLLGVLAAGAIGLNGTAVAQGQGGGPGGVPGGGRAVGPPSGGAETPDYGDLIILLRDANGVPIPSPPVIVPDPESGLLVDGGLCWQPIAAEDFSYVGWDVPTDRVVVPTVSTPVDGGWLIPVDQYNCAVESFFGAHTQEVEFGRVNEARSPDSVFAGQLEDVLIKLATADTTSLDPAGRMVTSTCGEGEDTITSTIDSPLQNLAVYRQLMLTGSIGTELPENADYLLTAARGLGVASDKGGAVNVDMVAYINMLMGLDVAPTMLPKLSETYREEVQGTIQPVVKQFLDYGAFGYERGGNFGALPSPAYIPEEAPVSGYFEYLWLVPLSDPPEFEILRGPIMTAVFGTDLGFLGGNIGGFAQAADDTRAVINFMHDWPIPDADVYGTPVPCTPNPELTTYDVSISDVSGLQVPTRMVDGSEGREFTVTVANAGPDAASGTITVTATAYTATPDEIHIDASPWVYTFDDLEAGTALSFTEFFTIDLGERTTIDWTATATTVETDVNLANNSVTGVSNVKVTSGGGGH